MPWNILFFSLILNKIEDAYVLNVKGYMCGGACKHSKSHYFTIVILKLPWVSSELFLWVYLLSNCRSSGWSSFFFKGINRTSIWLKSTMDNWKWVVSELKANPTKVRIPLKRYEESYHLWSHAQVFSLSWGSFNEVDVSHGHLSNFFYIIYILEKEKE